MIINSNTSNELFKIGTYTGNGEESQFINLGKTPKAVLISPNGAISMNWESRANYTNGSPYNCFAINGFPSYSSGAIEGQEDSRKTCEIIENGFRCFYSSGAEYSQRTNVKNLKYYYIALF